MASDDDFSGSDLGEQMDWNIEFNDDAYGSVYKLCAGYLRFSEHELVEKLTRILKGLGLLVHGVLRQTDENGKTVLHHAIDNRRSFNFCKVLIDHEPNLVKTSCNSNSLPIHAACNCEDDYHELIKFLISQYPESVNIPDVSNGWYPVQCYIYSLQDRLEVLQILLKCDEKALSTADIDGDLPLHTAVKSGNSIDTIQEVFNAYPQALFCEDDFGDTPSDIAQGHYDDDTIFYFFFEHMELANQARIITTPDECGRLPIHRTLLSRNASLGTIKLMVAANPTSISVADNKGRIPLHIASQTVGLPIVDEGSGPLERENQIVDLRIVKFLVQTNKASLNISDSKGNFALHHACAEGNCGVVNFILTQSTQGVSVHNMDGKLPIELLTYEVGSDFFDINDNQWHRARRHGQNYRETEEYVEAVYNLLRVHPEALKELAE